MKFKFKSVVAGAIAVGIGGTGLAMMAAPAAFATSPPQTAPPWEPDANASAYGGIVFYNAAGIPVINGTGDLANAWSYAVGDTPIDTGATKATLAFAQVEPPPATPSTWSAQAQAGTTTWSTLTSANTPSSVLSDVNTYPVVTEGTTGANFNSFASAFPSSTTAGYIDIAEVRLTDSGPGAGNPAGTYWEADVAYNTTASAVTVDGTSVPANGWAELFPFSNPSTIGLTTTATGGTLPTGSSITLNASVTPTTAAGTVLFFDGTTQIGSVAASGGAAAFTYAPAAGPHSYSADFVPGAPPGDPSGTTTATAAIIGGSASSTVGVIVGTVVATTTSLAASSTSTNSATPDTFTATVGAADSSTAGVTGSVQFKLAGSNLGSPVTTTVTGAGTTASPGVGTAALSTDLPAGSDSITAVFTPANGAGNPPNTTYTGSTSSAVVVSVTQAGPCASTGSNCSDTQNLNVTINPGTITITTPYTSANPFVLPAMTLSSDGTFFQSSATFPATTLPGAQQIVVTSSVAPAYAWTLSVSATPLVSGTNTIPSSGLGLTGGTLINASGTGAYPGTVTFTNIPAHNPSPVDTDTNTGLTAVPQTFALSSAADGTAEMDGTLTLFAATSTPAATYSGTITFTVS